MPPAALSSIPTMNPGSRAGWIWMRKYTLTLLHQRKGIETEQVYYHRDAYVFAEGTGLFGLIMTESNEARPKPASIYNPIDTVAHKHRFSGDSCVAGQNATWFPSGTGGTLRVSCSLSISRRTRVPAKAKLKGEARNSSPQDCTLPVLFRPLRDRIYLYPGGRVAERNRGMRRPPGHQVLFRGLFRTKEDSSFGPPK